MGFILYSKISGISVVLDPIAELARLTELSATKLNVAGLWLENWKCGNLLILNKIIGT